jgi:L-ascorbate metabolism protein UlaG (beta-lactamase superfamily)
VARLTWVGHSTVLVELDGVRLLTDPVLRPRVMHLRRVAPRPAPLGPLDAVLVSHAHWDHLDRRSLPRGVPVVLPRGAGRLLTRHGYEVVELDVGEETAFGGVRVRATEAEHDASRGPFGVRAPALGFAISGSRRVYFAGDTDLFDGMAGLVDDLDAALLPVAGWGPRLPAGHLDARAAAQAVALLRPRIAVPIHWGTYVRIGLQTSSEPPREFERAVAELAPGVDVRVLQPGGSTEL